MIINLTETEAVTIAEFLVKTIEKIKAAGLQKDPQTALFIESAHHLIVQVWGQLDERKKNEIIQEVERKLKDVN